MKDTLLKIATGIVVATFSAILGWAVAQGSKPEIQIQIDRPLLLSSERITVFRVRNVGGAPASNIELRFATRVAASAVFAITPLPVTPQQSARTLLAIPKLRPRDDISFYVKEAAQVSDDPRTLIEQAVYDEGQVGISTNDDRLSTYVLMQRITSGSVGFMLGFAFFATIVVVEKLREKKPNQPSEPMAMTVTPPSTQVPRQS